MEYSTTYSQERILTENAFIRRVYNWMVLGLGFTGIVSLFVTSNQALARIIYGNSLLFFGLIILEFALVFGLSGGISRMQASTAVFIFLLYSALNGLTLSVIFLAYTSASVTSTFFITAGTFAVVSFWGYTTKRNLTSWGHFLFMGLIGIILASLVNLFLHSSGVYWAVTYLGVMIFVGLTAYDTQKLKEMAVHGFGNGKTESKAAIIGALRLYLDFINLFLLLLRLLGRRR
jgi:FtsH-binding integral membrane protein